jgi:hypothetical protein
VGQQAHQDKATQAETQTLAALKQAVAAVVHQQ